MSQTLPKNASTVISMAGAASWLMPVGALALVGLSEKGGAAVPLSTHTLIVLATAASAAGLALGAGAIAGGLRKANGHSRRAFLGTIVSATILLVVGIASVSGSVSGREAERALSLAADAAARGYPGWNGGGIVDGCRFSAFEVDANSELSRILVSPYDRAFHIVLLSADNGAGARDVVLDVGSARLQRTDARMTPSLVRTEVLAHMIEGQPSAVLPPAGPVDVPAGARSDAIPILFSPTESLRDVASIEIRVDGAPRALRGRYFTLEEKRAIDATFERRGGVL